ncbi:MAG: DUF4340 domain-containing protein [Bdellovibrio sp.]
MKIKGRTILVLALLLFGGYAVYDFFQEKKIEERAVEDARLMTVNFDQVNKVEIHKKNSKIVLNRTVDGWELTEPIKDLADNNAVEDFIKNVFPERIIEVAKEGDNIDWSLYGLDNPLGTITFKTTANTQNVFEISEKKNFEDNVFGRRDKANAVLVINSVWQNRVNKTVNDFRDRHFLRQKIASVDEVKVKNDKGTLELKRVEGKWISPKKSDLKLDQNKVREILTAIADAKAADILPADAKIPKGKHLLTMDLAMADKKFNAEVTQAEDLAIYSKISEPASVMKMESGALDKFIHLTVESLKEEPVKEPPKKEEQKDKKINETKDESSLAVTKDKK